MPIEPRPRVLADFAGRWQLDRQIAHADGTQAVFEGTAVWSGDADGMTYREVGVLRVGEAVGMQAERQYRWGPGLDIYFDDGRFFHKVPAVGGEAVHWCDPDSYKVTYDFQHWPQFRAVWRVTGPRKCYTMRSHYSRR